MANFRATILGCGSSPGVPRISNDWGACDPSEPKNRRSRCSLLIERFESLSGKPTRILVDTGPDVRNQLLAAHVDRLDGVIYTHAHADHIHGIDDLRAFWLNTKRLVDVYSDDATTRRLFEAFGYCFTAPPGSFYQPMLRHTPIGAGTTFAIDGPGGPIEVRPFRQIHGDIDTLGLRVGGLAYSCDVSHLPDEALPELDGLDLWIVDALRYRPHPSHFSVSDALHWIERLRPRRAVLTHMHSDLDYQALRRELPGDIEPAFDGMQVEFRER
jgi:phosphoribosyl 1,2-cyclic phosphate phosphodiesterase